MKKLLLILLASQLMIVSCKNKNAELQSAVAALPDQSAFDTIVMGKQVKLFYLTNGKIKAAITNYGARVVSLLVPDSAGVPRDVIVGFGDARSFISGKERYFGAIVGRYGNRIANGKFQLDGVTYQLDTNNAPNALHGGPTGMHSRVWDAVQKDSQTLVLTYVSPDGEEGYPGTLTTTVTYTITKNNELAIAYDITTDKTTVINITNHNYWNLNGEGSGTINNHRLMIKASKMTAVDSTLIPVAIVPVANTPFDFTVLHTIGERINANDTQLRYGKGYDHNFILDKGITANPEHIAAVQGDQSGIVMDIYSTEPALQFYGGNFMQGFNKLKCGKQDEHRTAFCLETQHYPDSPNQPAFPTTVLEKGKAYHSVTIHRFSSAALK